MTEPPIDPIDAKDDNKARYDIPDLLSDADPNAYAAFLKQAGDLHAAADLLGDAWNLVGLMLTIVGNTGDARDMQTEAGLKAVEEKLRQANARIDEHQTHYANLFLAYCELKARSAP